MFLLPYVPISIFRFHLPCIQKLAINSGYFFKCPMCNNKDEFEAEMKKFGIYIPEQDAAWEREGNIYDGIYERHGTCDAENCKLEKSLSFLSELISCNFFFVHFPGFLKVSKGHY